MTSDLQPTQLQVVKQDFDVRFYQWALNDFRREIEQGFPLLRLVQNKLALRVVAKMEAMDQAAQVKLAAALVKRFHRKAAESRGEALTADDEKLIQDYIDGLRAITTPPLSTQEQAVEDRFSLLAKEALDHPRRKVNRKLLSDFIKADLKSVFTSDPEQTQPHSWRYTTVLDIPSAILPADPPSKVTGKLTVHTDVDVSGTAHSLVYTHRIALAAADHGGQTGRFSTIPDTTSSLLSWLGIAGQTTWDYLTDNDAPRAARSLTRLCDHFINELRNIMIAAQS